MESVELKNFLRQRSREAGGNSVELADLINAPLHHPMKSGGEGGMEWRSMWDIPLIPFPRLASVLENLNVVTAKAHPDAMFLPTAVMDFQVWAGGMEEYV